MLYPSGELLLHGDDRPSASADAGRHFPLLEYSSREYAGGSQTGRGGPADHVVSRPEHGLASETEGGRRRCGGTATRSGRGKNIDNLYQNRVESAVPTSAPDRPASAVRWNNTFRGPCHKKTRGAVHLLKNKWMRQPRDELQSYGY